MSPPIEALLEVVNLAGALGLSEGGDDGATTCSAAVQQQQGASRNNPMDSSSPCSTEALLGIADAARQLCNRHLASLSAARHAVAADLTDPSCLQRRAAAMCANTETLKRIITSKHVIADRLRASKLRPSVPVDPAHQREFEALLQQSAGGRALLDHGALALGWAAALDAPPSCWEDTLRSIPEGTRACRAHLKSLSAFGSQLAAEEASAAASAAAAGSGQQ